MMVEEKEFNKEFWTFIYLVLTDKALLSEEGRRIRQGVQEGRLTVDKEVVEKAVGLVTEALLP